MNFNNSMMPHYPYLDLNTTMRNNGQYDLHNVYRSKVATALPEQLTIHPRRGLLQLSEPRLVHPKKRESPLNMLSDVAARSDNGKRQAMYETNGQEARRKRLRLDSYSNKQNKPRFNSLLKRISALGGGFPMPKHAQESSQESNVSSTVKTTSKRSSRIGAFPMPALDGAVVIKCPDLVAYKSLWRSIDSDELRYDIFQRKVSRCDVNL